MPALQYFVRTLGASSPSEEEVAEEDPYPMASPSPGPDDNQGSDAEDDGISSPVGDLPPATPMVEGSPPETSPPMASPAVESDEEVAEANVSEATEKRDVAESTEEKGEAAEMSKDAELDDSPPEGFVDPLNETNYVVVELPKPMGIVFEANVPFSGVFIQEFAGNGAAEKDGKLKLLDQLVGVGGISVKGRSFDECIDSIVNDPARLTRLVVFRGKAEYLYHAKLGASHKWLKNFLKKLESGKANG